MSLNLALFEPDIPQNTGAAIRLCACLGVGLDIIEPSGFLWDKKKIRQSAMDYFDAVNLMKYSSWNVFYAHAKKENRRCVLMTTKADHSHVEFKFQSNDILIAGRESAGVPEAVHDACDARIGIPMMPDVRSLNVITASSIILAEALRQTDGYYR